MLFKAEPLGSANVTRLREVVLPRAVQVSPPGNLVTLWMANVFVGAAIAVVIDRIVF